MYEFFIWVFGCAIAFGLFFIWEDYYLNNRD